MAMSHLVCVGWAWHAPDKGGSVGNFWSEGWAWGPALSKLAARTALSPLQQKGCSCSTGWASPALSNVEPPGEETIHLKRGQAALTIKYIHNNITQWLISQRKLVRRNNFQTHRTSLFNFTFQRHQVCLKAEFGRDVSKMMHLHTFWSWIFQ